MDLLSRCLNVFVISNLKKKKNLMPYNCLKNNSLSILLRLLPSRYPSVLDWIFSKRAQCISKTLVLKLLCDEMTTYGYEASLDCKIRKCHFHQVLFW